MLLTLLSHGAGAADGADPRKRDKRRILHADELGPAKSVEQQVREYLDARNAPAPESPQITSPAPEIAQAQYDDEDEIIMLLLAA